MAKEYQIVEPKEEFRKLNKAGELETWYRIFATTRKGSYFHVEVPLSGLEHADKLLTERAVLLDSI